MFDKDDARARYLTRADLVRKLDLVGATYRFAEDGPDDQRVLYGSFDTLQLRPGLVLHTACVRDLQTMESGNRLHPGIKIALLAGGATELAYGHHGFRLGPHWKGQDEGGALVNLAEEDGFARRWRAGRVERKVSLTLMPQWLEEGGLACHGAHRELARFCAEHLARARWRPGPRARALARRILAPGMLEPGMGRLRLEAHCIELAGEALGAIGTQAPHAPQSLNARETQRLAALEELLRASGLEAPTMDGIARALGTNPVTLQALTRRAWGCTVFERLRTIRMERARAALQAGASVAQAAEEAGFAGAANFATAYKARFGITPRAARALGDR